MAGLGELPLFQAADPGQTVAVRAGGGRVDAARMLADVQAVAARLPVGRFVLNWCGDRYAFAVVLCAAILTDRICLLPSNHSVETTRRLADDHPGLQVITDRMAEVPRGVPLVRYDELLHDGAADAAVAADASHAAVADGAAGSPDAPATTGTFGIPSIPCGRTVARVFTSGSTGRPVPHDKTFGSLVYNVQSEALALGPDPRACIVGTVPPQHMYGFESTVLIALHNGLALHAGRPFFPADVAQALADCGDAPRVLVTTPFHLRTLLLAALPLPEVQTVVSATAPLSGELAQQAEAALHAPLVEIYGSTESGQVATRRTTHDAAWTTFRGLAITQRDGASFVHGGHVTAPTRLGDVIEAVDATHFRLVGRDEDMVNIAGKRTSIAHLNHLLTTLPGVMDGAFVNTEAGDADTARLAAVYSSDTLPPEQVLHALRAHVDPVFLPRPLRRVPRMPRADTGKLPRHALLALLQPGDDAAVTAAADAGAGAAQPQPQPQPQTQPPPQPPSGARPAAPAGAPPQNPPAIAPDASREASPKASPDAPPRAELRVHVPADHPAFDGHFPGHPVLPGVVLLDLVVAAIRQRFAAPDHPYTLRVARFHAMVRPDTWLDVAIDLRDPTSFQISAGDTRVASGTFDGLIVAERGTGGADR